MSRSRHSPIHSPRGSTHGNHNLSVTQATFQGPNLQETAGSQHLSLPSAYQSSDSRYRRPSYPQSGLGENYLESGYDPSIYTRASSSERFINPQPTSPVPTFGILDPDPLSFSIDPDLGNFEIPQNISDPTLVANSDMGSFAFQSDPLGSNYREQNSFNSRSSAMRDYAYSSADNSQRRSTSGPSGPSIMPSSAFGGLSTEEREVARQRRQVLQESRRQSKVRVRRTQLPSALGLRSSKVQEVSRSIDSFAASSNASSYEIGNPPYGRTSSVSSTQGPYVGGISASPTTYDMQYQTGYIDNVNPQTVYNSPHAPSLPSMPNPSQNYRSRPTSTASIPDEPIRILETRSRPQCWDHGCNGRQFSTFSNLLRHQREKSGTATKSYCPRCGAEFTRTTARNGHMAHEKCKPRSADDH